MGGSNETMIGALRIHENSGVVHIHDDTQNLKFIKNADSFKKEISDILNQPKIVQGTHIINGDTSTSLYLIVEGRDVSCCLKGTSVLKDLSIFIKGN